MVYTSPQPVSGLKHIKFKTVSKMTHKYTEKPILTKNKTDQNSIFRGACGKKFRFHFMNKILVKR